MTTLSLRHLKKRYEDGHIAVSGVSLETRKKEFIVLVGPSGCGKTTTLRMIAGLEEITEGEFFLDGKRMNDIPPDRRDMAMVFQNYALYPHMTVAQNIGYSLKLRKVPKDEIAVRVRAAAEMLSLQDVLSKKPGMLSGGQRQRVAMGRALVREPSLFLLDEPLSNLDAKLRAQMRAEIARLYAASPATFLYVTHDQVEAMTLGTVIVVMKGGVIQQIGAPGELYDRPANLFVATFIGTPAMNILPATVLRDADAIKVLLLTERFPIDGKRAQELADAGKLSEPVLVGFRPEHIRLESDAALRATVEVVERLGSESLVHVRCGRENLILRTQGDVPLAPGDETGVHFDLEKAHFFDPETERVLAADAEEPDAPQAALGREGQ